MHRLRQNLKEGGSYHPDSPLQEKLPNAALTRGLLRRVAIRRLERRKVHQRNEDRYVIGNIRAFAKWDHLSTQVKIANMSSNGLMIETERVAEIGTSVSVTFPDCNPVRCSVRWVRDGRIGLEYIEETEILADAGVQDMILQKIADLLGDPNAISERRVGYEQRCKEQRHDLVWVGALSIGHDTYPVRLRNISASGAMLALEDECDHIEGERAMLDLGEAGQVNGLVKWSAGFELGMEFATAFDLSALVAQPAVHTDFEYDAAMDRALAEAEAAEDVGEPGHYNREVAAPHTAPDLEYRRLTLDEIYSTLYPDGERPAPKPRVPEGFEGDDSRGGDLPGIDG